MAIICYFSSARVTHSGNNPQVYGINKDWFIYRLTDFPKTKVLRMARVIFIKSQA